MTNAIAAAAKLEIHPPLARDPAGNLVPVPEGTAAWRLCRETSGRPREVRGPDRQPVRFPLHASSDDIADLCGPGVYRVYALDALGEQLVDEHIAKWDLTAGRELRNAAVDPMIVLRSPPTAPAVGTQTDLRFALEAMAQMMRTNTDALRLVAESQVDLAKAIAAAKGLPRNVAFPPLSPTAPANLSTDDVEDEDEGEYLEPTRPTNVYDLLMPFSEKAAELAPVFLGLGGLDQPGAAPVPAPDVTGSVAAGPELASRPFEVRELIDLNYAHQKGAAKRAEASAAEARASIQRRIMTDPQLVKQVMAVKSALGADEVNELIAAAASWPLADQEELLGRIKPLSTERAVLFCREILNHIRTQQQRTED